MTSHDLSRMLETWDIWTSHVFPGDKIMCKPEYHNIYKSSVTFESKTIVSKTVCMSAE